jgi:hypothetical protein
MKLMKMRFLKKLLSMHREGENTQDQKYILLFIKFNGYHGYHGILLCY